MDDSCDLSTIEGVTEITNTKSTILGNIGLHIRRTNFIISFVPCLKTVFSIFNHAEESPHKWCANEPMFIHISKLDRISFTESPFTLILHHADNMEPRKYLLNSTDFTEISCFVEKLLTNVICVPHNEKEHTLRIFKRAKYNNKLHIPPFYEIQSLDFSSFSDFWNAVLDLSFKILIHLDASNSMPSDEDFPFVSAAIHSNNQLLNRYKEYDSKSNSKTEITCDIWNSYFDEKGKIKDIETVMANLRLNIISEETLPLILPFAVGLFPFNSTLEERNMILNQAEKDYHVYLKQLQNQQPEQVSRNSKLKLSMRIIHQDVIRTDRSTTPFKNSKSKGLIILEEILQVLCIYNPPVSYSQGMNDLLVPFLLLFYNQWNADGYPIDKEGNEIDMKDKKFLIFACFDAFMNKINHYNFIINMFDECNTTPKLSRKILKQASPFINIWLKKMNLQDLIFISPEFTLLFKRSFKNIWQVWIPMCLSIDPPNFMKFFIAALLITLFKDLITMHDVSMCTLMEFVPSLMINSDVSYLTHLTYFLMDHFQLEPIINNEENEPLANDEFSFFECQWTKEQDLKIY